MNILIVGCGKIGKTVVEHTVVEGHNVTIVDSDPKIIEDICNSYDVIGVCGNGSNIEILENCKIDRMDLVVACSSSDETNILCCLFANKLGAKSTIARVRDYNYYSQLNEMAEILGITLIFNPDLDTANEIMRIINFPEANKVETFANGDVDIVEFYISEDSKLVGQNISTLSLKYQTKLLVCAVSREGKVFIPKGSYEFKAKDKIYLTSSRNSLRTFFYKNGLLADKIKSILIIGGSRIALYLALLLQKNNYKVTIIESNPERCSELNELLPKTTIINGDGTDTRILEEEGIYNTDAVICLTGMDEENIIISMFANKINVPKVITKINRPYFANMIGVIDSIPTVTPKEISANRIVSHIRAMNNTRGSNVITLYKLVEGKVEALEFIAKNDSKVLNTPLSKLAIKQNVLIAGIINKNEVIIPNGNSIIEEGNHVIVVTTNSSLDDLDDILE